jgi:thiol-disulfide isomerase/thioredoxin
LKVFFLVLGIAGLGAGALGLDPPAPAPTAAPAKSDAAPAGAAQTQPQAQAPGATPPSPGNARWAADANEAKARAAAEGKLVYVEFDARGCGQCRRMDALLYPAFDFEALLIPMVPVKVGLDLPEGRELARRYGIRDTPAVLVTSPEGRLVFRMEGFTNTSEFYQHIHQDLNAYRVFAKRIEGQDIAHLPAAEALATGRELYQRSDSEAAVPRLRRAASDPKAPAAVRDEAREILAAVELDLGQVAASRRAIEQLLISTKDPRSRERAELFRAQLPLAENKPAEALALFRKFQKDHPKSPYIEQVNAMLAKLSEAPAQ